MTGRSLGKALLGLKVVPLDPQRPAPAASSGPGIGAAATRSGVLVVLLVLAAVGVGLWWSARSGHLPELARRRGSWLNLHDRIAGTLVARTAEWAAARHVALGLNGPGTGPHPGPRVPRRQFRNQAVR